MTAPGWVNAAELPGNGSDGFTALAGFAHPSTSAAVGIRYASAASDFDPADFLEVADPRRASESVEYWLSGSLVAERQGRQDDGAVCAAAAHRRSRHLFLITVEWPIAAEMEVASALAAFRAGLLLEAPPHAPVESYVSARPSAVPIMFEYPARCSLKPAGAGVVLRAAYGNRQHAEIVLGVADCINLESALSLRAIDLHLRAGKPVPSSVRTLSFATRPPSAVTRAAVRICELEDGRETTVALLALPAPPGRVVTLDAIYPGQEQSPTAWMATRFAVRRLVASCRPQEG